MDSNDIDIKATIIAKTVLRFLLGAVCGLIFVGKFIMGYFSFDSDISTVQIVVSVLFPATCGILSARWGNEALPWLGKLSD
jgi:hypothetical protein